MRVKFSDQSMTEDVTLTSGYEFNALSFPEIYPGDAILPRAAGYFFVSGQLESAVKGLISFFCGLSSRPDQATPTTFFSTQRLYAVAGFAYFCAAAGEGIPSIMEVNDMFPLPQGLPVWPAASRLALATQVGSNITVNGTLKVRVIVGYDIVTLTQSEQARYLAR